jgi:hypothetical protein
MKLNKLLFFILMFLGFSKVLAATDCTQVTQIPQIECEALIALYNSTNGPAWVNNTDWNVTNTPCSWYGISCFIGYVNGIGLDFNKLGGLIPIELGNLSKLKALRLEGNQLSGSIPPELGNLSNLLELHLNENQLSGSIPAELGNLSGLLGLRLYGNQLSGSIPVELGNLSNLLGLYLHGNQLSGSIPIELGNLSNLLGLYLYGNRLSGSIPSELGNLSNLEGLYLHGNQLCGDIPLSLINLNNLHVLGLENNGLNVTDLDPQLEAFFYGLEQAAWKPQDPSTCPPSLATLATFEVIPNSTGILLKWQTLVEDKNAGYFIWRGQPNNSRCNSHPEDYHDIVLVGFEASKSDNFSGTTYLYQDNTVKPKTTYCYLLEDRDFGGNSTFHWDSIVSVTTD